MWATFSGSEYFSEYEFMVIHNVEKASAHNCAQIMPQGCSVRVNDPASVEFGRGFRLEIEYFRLQIEYLWNTFNLK